MANYKVVDADQLNSAMSATADSIRAKTGGTDPVVWDLDNGFKSAVEGIQTGGAGENIGMSLESSAIGFLPEYSIGIADSNMDLTGSFTSNAIGTLT